MRSLRGLVFAWLTVLAMSMLAHAQAPAFRAVADGVTVDVSVQTGTRPITTLQIADFELLDNGVRQTIVDLTYGKLPIDVTVALDISYSVRGAMLDRLRRAVGQLMRDLRPEDRLRLMLFNARVARVVDYSSDPAAVDAAMKSATAGGGTSLNDAISLALVASRAADRRQLIVAFTDGTDATSATSMSMLHEVANRTTATLTMVTPAATGTAAQPTLPFVPASMMGRGGGYAGLTASTGGSVVPFQANQDVGAIFRRVLDSFRSTYVLHFVPTGVQRGGFHELQVSVKRPNTTVTARRGYYGGS